MASSGRMWSGEGSARKSNQASCDQVIVTGERTLTNRWRGRAHRRDEAGGGDGEMATYKPTPGQAADRHLGPAICKMAPGAAFSLTPAKEGEKKRERGTVVQKRETVGVNVRPILYLGRSA